VLGLSNARMAVGRLDPDDVSLTDVTDAMGRPQQMSAVNESGLYELIIRSDKPDAKQFRRWITSVVLPEIRRTGSFVAVETPEQLLSRALIMANDTLTAKNEQIAELEPKAGAWDALASAKGDYAVGDAAKMLARAGIPTGPTRLFGQLADLKWTFRNSDGAWRAYAERVEKGYLAEKPSFHYHPKTGERVVDPPQVRVTIKGLERLRQRLHVGALTAVTA
jgi:anti-repressor protein